MFKVEFLQKAMEQSYLNRQNELHIEPEEKKLYEELDNMLSEWFRMFFNDKKNKDIFISKVTAQKYRSIRKYLNKHFLDDDDLKDYIKYLPNIWILKNWLIEILFVVCAVVFNFGNPYLFKIYMGVTYSRLGAELDAIYILYDFILGFIYFCFLVKRGNVYEDLKYNLSTISDIVRKKLL